MTDAELRARLSDRATLALTMWAEGRGDQREGRSSVEERLAIGCVIRNRLIRPSAFGASERTYRGICLAPSQFSCWIPMGGRANYVAVMALTRTIVDGGVTHDPLFVETQYLADGLITGVILDRTAGATMYYAPKAMSPPGRVPSWAENKVGLPIGDQLFFAA